MEKYTAKKARNQEAKNNMAYKLSPRGFERFDNCGKFLIFYADKGMKKMKLHRGSFCMNRFCPMCSWRRAKRDALQISCCIQHIKAAHDKAFIFLTLTAPNVSADKLSEEITRYNLAFKNLMKRKEVLPINKGYARKLEITYNKKRDDYHPHFHVLMALNKTYFTQSGVYLNRDRWLALWQSCMKDNTISQVDIRHMKENGGKEILELATYSAKDSDLYASEKVFDVYYKALQGRQAITYNGLFKDAVKLYKEGKLDKYKAVDNTRYIYMLLYQWGYGEYIEKTKRELTESEIKGMSKTVNESEVD